MGSEANWAHIIWQRHNLRPDEFEAMPPQKKAFFIASEIIAHSKEDN